jgi:hypothetical protein
MVVPVGRKNSSGGTMNARPVSRRIRWTHLASVAACVLFAACAEPSTVDPKLVPEASIDVVPDTSDADSGDSGDSSTGSGGSGGSGGTGGSGGSGGTGGVSADAADVRGDSGDAGDAREEMAADASSDAASDTPVADTTIPPEGAADVRDAIAEPSLDSGARDGAADAAGDRG